jgi:hypothetical protein
MAKRRHPSFLPAGGPEWLRLQQAKPPRQPVLAPKAALKILWSVDT